MSVTLTGDAFDDSSHLLISQGGDTTLTVNLAIEPRRAAVPNAGGTTTTVWVPIASVVLYAELQEEIHCRDVRGIAGGCRTLPRKGARIPVGATMRPGGDPCVDPGTVTASTNIARDLLAVKADGSGGGPGVWQLEAVVTTALVPIGACSPATVAAVAATTSTDTGPDTTTVALRLADVVGG